MFRVGDQRVGAIMTPRLDIEWVDVNATDDELREFLGGHSHGQFVVCKERSTTSSARCAPPTC